MTRQGAMLVAQAYRVLDHHSAVLKELSTNHPSCLVYRKGAFVGAQHQAVAEVFLGQVCKVAGAILMALMISDMSYKHLADR